MISLGQAYPEYRSKLVSITNGYDPESFVADPVPPLAGEHVEITHIGEIYANRDPAPFLEAIRGLVTDHGAKSRFLRVRFFGRLGAAQHRLEDVIRGGALEGTVDLCGQVPYHESLRAMVRS